MYGQCYIECTLKKTFFGALVSKQFEASKLSGQGSEESFRIKVVESELYRNGISVKAFRDSISW